MAAASSRNSNSRCKSCIPTAMAAINTPPPNHIVLQNPRPPIVCQKLKSTEERNEQKEYTKSGKDSYYLPTDEYADCTKSKCYDTANSDRQSMATSDKMNISKSRISRKDSLFFKKEHAPNKQLYKSSVISSTSSTHLAIKHIDYLNRKNSNVLNMSKETNREDWPCKRPLLGLNKLVETQNVSCKNKTKTKLSQPSQR